MNEKDRRNPELKGLLREGAIAFLPLGWLLLPALSQAALSFGVAAVVWFLGRCVFVDDWQAASACTWLPELAGEQWTLLVRTLLVTGFVYVFLARLTVRRNLYVSFRSRRLRLHRVYSVYVAVTLAARVVVLMYTFPQFSSFGFLIFLPLIFFFIWLWRVHLDLWALGLGWHVFPLQQQIAVTARMMLFRQLWLRSPLEIEVMANADGLTIRGPLDAVDEERARDLLTSRFTTPFQFKTETTLSDDLYWKSYRDPLQRSKYESPPIPEPLSIPRAVPVGLTTVVVALFWLALRMGPGFGIGITPEDISSFFEQHNLVPPESMQSVTQERRTLRASDVSDPSELIFDPIWLDMEGSLESCPTLAHTYWRVMHVMELEGFVGPRIDPDNPEDMRRYGDVVVRIYSGGSHTVFAFDRKTGMCILAWRESTESRARRYAERIGGVLISNWKRVDRAMDWQHVPPVPLEEASVL